MFFSDDFNIDNIEIHTLTNEQHYSIIFRSNNLSYVTSLNLKIGTWEGKFSSKEQEKIKLFIQNEGIFSEDIYNTFIELKNYINSIQI